MQLQSQSHRSYITKPGRVRQTSEAAFPPRRKLVEEVSNFGGLAVTRRAIESGHVLVRETMQRALISAADVEP
ncbi:hypothetical protein EYF80_032002 [Liparis tanakae]|uniref:Uncharacterized protein n=1 Tax=Liparis tanakae TaxID=230148 RepID=A0A4Z2GW57_9TELE|nr:hypothetical protein EYF80_032002 [Liparis tanakae]